MQISQYENIKANYKKGSFVRVVIQSPAKTLVAAKKAGYTDRTYNPTWL